MTTSRIPQLARWLTECTGQISNLRPITNGAGHRQYFRFEAKSDSYIAMDSFADSHGLSIAEDKAFIAIRTLLDKHQFRVPQIFHHDSKYGFFHLEDFGTLHLESSSQQASGYKMALTTLRQFQQIPLHELAFLPQYDRQAISNELALFEQWFIEGFLQSSLSDHQKQRLQECFEILIKRFEEQPQGFVHRDFHCRNLMILNNNQLGVIDFQDALMGPLGYDCASLVYDAYVDFTPQLQQQLLLYFYQQLQLRDICFDTFCNWVNDCAIQRHIKVVGIFCRLGLRDNKTLYFSYLDRVLSRLVDLTANDRAFEPFNQMLVTHLLPKLYPIS